METLTLEQQEQNRQDRLAEVGTEPPCPLCGRPRVKRSGSNYIRCNPCGLNWLAGEELGRNPKSERWEKVLMEARRQNAQRQGTTSAASAKLA